MKSLLATTGLALTVLAAAIPAAAQTSKFEKMDEAAIQRSHEIQAQVARIDQDKEAFIREFVASWAPYLNRSPLFANYAKELMPLLRAATPWRIYAASLVGDYNGMVQVLKGEVAAGKVINTLSVAQPKLTPGAALKVGGSALIDPSLSTITGQLAFTPIAPCRIADTRGSGARTGILSAGVSRAFDLTTDAFTKGQGGSTSCPGLPSFSNYAWSVNITLTGYTTPGFVTVYPFGGSLPPTSLVNYGTALPAIANSSTLTGCYSCSDDIYVYAFSPTHVILDVYGYYEQITGYGTSSLTGTITTTQVAGTTATVLAGAYQFISGGTCPAGTKVIGGGMTSSGSSIVPSDHNISGSLWYEYVKSNATSGSSTVTVYSTCADIT
jgi:hypothetical protein